MQLNYDPRLFLGAGLVLLLIGFILPLLMVLQITESTLFLNFFSYFALTLGSMAGFIGITALVNRRR